MKSENYSTQHPDNAVLRIGKTTATDLSVQARKLPNA